MILIYAICHKLILVIKDGRNHRISGNLLAPNYQKICPCVQSKGMVC